LGYSRNAQCYGCKSRRIIKRRPNPFRTNRFELTYDRTDKIWFQPVGDICIHIRGRGRDVPTGRLYNAT